MGDEKIPETVNVLPNGAWQDKKSGLIVKAAPGQLWDSKKASEMAKLRHAKLKAKTAEGILEAVQEKNPGKMFEDFPDAHKQVAKTLMKEVVLDDTGTVKGGDKMKTYESLLSMEGSMGNVKRPEGGEVPGMSITFSPEVAKHLIEGALRWKAKQLGGVVLDGEFKVVGEEVPSE